MTSSTTVRTLFRSTRTSRNVLSFTGTRELIEMSFGMCSTAMQILLCQCSTKKNCWRTADMRRCVPFMILVVFACMFCISCSLEDFQIDSLVAVPYLIMDSNQMGLSLFIDTSLVEEKVPMQFHE